MRLVVPIAAALLASCQNPCATLCVRMADYAESCGFTVPPDEIRECKERQRGGGSRGDHSLCREYNGQRALREEWTCDDLEDYFSADGGSDTAR